MKIVSWNVNGIRAIIKKDFFEDIKKINPDIICIQETKAHPDQVDEMLGDYEHHFWNSAEKKGYSGVAIFSKIKPLSVSYGIGIEEHDKEGRVLTTEFDDFFLVDCYTPNSGRGLTRISYRKDWDKAFAKYISGLSKPVVLCGDLNVAHTDIDLANPKPNYNKNAGYTQIEIDGLNNLLKTGLVDSFRYFYPDKKNIYTWWSYMFGARSRNVGWRIDYFLVSREFMNNVKSSEIFDSVMGSDHCPVVLDL